MDRFYVYEYDDEYIYLNIDQVSAFILTILENNNLSRCEMDEIFDDLFFFYDNDEESEHIIIDYDGINDRFMLTIMDNEGDIIYASSDMKNTELDDMLEHEVDSYILKIRRELVPDKLINYVNNEDVKDNCCAIIDSSKDTKVMNSIDFGMRVLKKGDALSLIKDGNFITCEMIDKDFAKIVVKTENILSLSEGNYDELVMDNESVIMITMEDKVMNTLVFGDFETKKTYYISNGEMGFEGLLEIMTNPDTGNEFKKIMDKIFKKITKHVRVMKKRKYKNENKRWEIEG